MELAVKSNLGIEDFKQFSVSLHFTARSDPNDLFVFQTSKHHKGHLETRKNIVINFKDGS